MEHNIVVDQLIALLHKTLQQKRDVSASSQLIAEVGLESIQVIEFLCEVEDHFDLVIDENAIASVQTVNDLADVVMRLGAAQ